MQEITEAITAKHAQVKTLQSDIDALQRAVSILGGAVENAGAVLLSGRGGRAPWETHRAWEKEGHCQGHPSAQDQAQAGGS